MVYSYLIISDEFVLLAAHPLALRHLLFGILSIPIHLTDFLNN